MQLISNSLLMELLVNASGSRVLEMVDDYIDKFSISVNRGYLKNITTYLDGLESMSQSPKPTSELPDLDIEKGIKFADDFQASS